MAAEPFNSQGGFTAGIPPVQVIDSNGNVVTNVLTTGNVTANVVYATYYRYANGQPLSVAAGGSNTQLQYNNNGVFAGIPNVTWNGNTLSLGNVSALSIGGGVNGYFLQTDGNGSLSWAAGGGGGNGTPGGSNTQVQFNNNGSFGASPAFEFYSSSNTLYVGGTVQADDILTNQVTVVGNIDATGNVTADYFIGDGSQLSNIVTDTANYVVQPDQANITSVGTLTGLTVAGNIATSGYVSAGNFITSGGLSAGNLSISVRANVTGNLRATGSINFATSPNVNLGTIANIRIDGGLNGYVLTTDGLGNLSWQAGGGGGGNGTPGGSNTQIQFNSAGTFGASPFLTFNNVTNTLNVAGNLIANSIEIGSGVYKFSRSNVFFATTSTTANTAIVSLVANTVSSVDYTIIATNPIAGNRQVSKLSAVMYDSTCNYNEYSTLNVNGFVGNFTIGYDPGNIIAPASVTLYVEPVAATLSTYKIQMTVYEE
jgi:hypothetical protein